MTNIIIIRNYLATLIQCIQDLQILKVDLKYKSQND